MIKIEVVEIETGKVALENLPWPITVCIPSLPERVEMRRRALASIAAQTYPPVSVLQGIDHDRKGEIATRNMLLNHVETSWIAWIDDDDEMLPWHLEMLYRASHDDYAGTDPNRVLMTLVAQNVDLVFSDYETIGAEYTASFIEPAYLCRTEALRAMGGFPEPEGTDWPYRYGDWGLLAKLLINGYSFRKVKVVTWRKYIHDSNICGVGF